MGHPLVEYEIDILQKLGELSRQMEEVNGLDKEMDGVQTENEESMDQEVSLNVDEPADQASLDSLKETGEGQGPSEDSSSSEETKEPASGKETPEAVEPVDSNAAPSEDELGIKLEDDELWDEGDVEEIPLFEEELLSEISQEEERQAQEEKRQKEENEAEKVKSSTLEDEASGSEYDSPSDVAEGEGGGEEAWEEKEGQMEAEELQQVARSQSLVARILPWAVTAISAILTVVAILTIWLLWKSPVKSQISQSGASNISSRPSEVKKTAIPQKRPHKAVADRQYEAIDLAPFIIPGKSGGELVFFKLQVELVVPDSITKQELLRRQAWLRDIIYQELKGLDISRGVKGDILDRYRAPLLKRLNMEFSPLRIQDIRLMGYLLR